MRSRNQSKQSRSQTGDSRRTASELTQQEEFLQMAMNFLSSRTEKSAFIITCDEDSGMIESLCHNMQVPQLIAVLEMIKAMALQKYTHGGIMSIGPAEVMTMTNEPIN